MTLRPASADALDTIISDLRAYIAQLRAQLAQAEQRAQVAKDAIARAATHLPGRPDLAEAILSDYMAERAEPSAPARAEPSE